eukprot:5566418-Amphidinium_carterae.1
MPWESVLKAAASSQEHWVRELTEPAFAWKISAREACRWRLLQGPWVEVNFAAPGAGVLMDAPSHARKHTSSHSQVAKSAGDAPCT